MIHLVRMETRSCLGQFRFVRTEPSSNSILKSISGRLRVNSIRIGVKNIDTKLDSPNFPKFYAKNVVISYFSKDLILECSKQRYRNRHLMSHPYLESVIFSTI